MYHINVYQRKRVFPHVVLRASTPEGCAVVKAVAWQQGYHTKVSHTSRGGTSLLDRLRDARKNGR